MNYYFNQGALTNNLYPAPNNALNNANNWSNFANQCGYTNYNGMQGCLPLQNNYTYPPGYGYMPFGSATNTFGNSAFGGYGYGNGTETNVSYTRNADGSVSYTSSSGAPKPSTGEYVAGISGIIASGFQNYFGSQVAQEQAKTQSIMTQYQIDAEKQAAKDRREDMKASMEANRMQSSILNLKILGELKKEFDQDA